MTVMAKTTLGFPDPDRDPMRNSRALFSTQRTLQGIQKSMQPFKEMQKSLRPFQTADLLRGIQRSMQPFQHDQVLRDMQKSMRRADTPRVLEGIQKSIQPFKTCEVQPALRAIEPFKASNLVRGIQEAMQTSVFQQTLDRSLARAAIPDLSAGIVETLRKSRIDLANLTLRSEDLERMGYVREVQVEARAEAEDAPSILGDWIAFLSNDHRRRLFLLSVAALTEALAYASTLAEQELPAHLDKLILFLLALSEALSEYLLGDADPEEPEESPAEADSKAS